MYTASDVDDINSSRAKYFAEFTQSISDSFPSDDPQFASSDSLPVGKIESVIIDDDFGSKVLTGNIQELLLKQKVRELFLILQGQS